ncbi:DUF1501 domain-containing protein [Sphingosinicella sp. LHD-64]|uniref:DUF1501 domain-containing protein n=1 Tax=Sphingosinicella sp. LHD-64 TaxID=3072139 RepID=UPI00280F8EA6|nr:DUF1501 domain-containing protein [Sphingosinicella sp. LHD-64]MDQ8758229.1 DUF1501 domain-containing protein [Sphingosinicella sp. LHD-64]
MFDRRAFLGGAAATGAVLLAAPHLAVAQAATDRRFVFIIQRGAADALGTLAPTGDPAFAQVRGAFAEDFASGARMGDFTLHPNLAEIARLHAAREALFVHAVASPYRERSHFDGQNVLETGGNAAYALRDGWMNRLLGLLPPAESRAIAVSATVPMVLRGSHEVSSYAPSALPDASDDLLARVSALYERDAELHAAWQQALQTRAIAGDLAQAGGRNAAATGTLAARLLTGEGARIAVIETGGWDTHAGQRARLGIQLRGLDAMIAALKTGLGPDWANTLVIVATEFGRTVAPNGTGGTDHGTGSMAMLLGGAVAGGRVIADWPGLGNAALHEGRDLKPTIDLDLLIASAMAEHYRLDPGRAGRTLFPNIASARPLEGLIRA